MALETSLESVQRRVREGEAVIGRQRDLIDRIKARGAPTGLANTILGMLLETQRMHLDQLERLTPR